MNDFWKRYQKAIGEALAKVVATDAEAQQLETETAFDRLCLWSVEVQTRGSTQHLVGNGASACMASHMALDWTKNARVHTTSHNDLASITALGNDFGYEQVFARPLEWFAREGDLLATISTSGNSPSILRAIAVARAKGLRTVTFSGLLPDNRSRAAGDLNFYVPAWSYGIVESVHQILLHVWLDRYMRVREWELDQPQVFET